jgi:hypothetical protein
VVGESASYWYRRVILPGDSAVSRGSRKLWKYPAPVTDAQDFLDQQVDGSGESVADAAGPPATLGIRGRNTEALDKGVSF